MSRRICSVLVCVLALAACNADRAGTLASPVVSVDSCSGTAGTTVVTWSNFNLASIKVAYRKDTTMYPSTWVAASGASSGSVSVSVPATAQADGWYVSAVSLATGANGGGTKKTLAIDCAAAVTTTTAPVATKPPVTLSPDSLPPVTIEPTITEVLPTVAPTTTQPTCSTLPSNSVAPTITRPGDGRVYVNEGTWSAGANCTFTGWAHAWERSWNNGAWAGFSGLQDWSEPTSCGYRYRVTVTKSNELGNTSATSAIVAAC